MSHIVKNLEINPIIAAVRKEEDLEQAVVSSVTTIFLLQADIFNLKSSVDRIKSSDKSCFIHIDLLEGLGRDFKSIDYIAQVIAPDGIISTKSNHIKYAIVAIYAGCGL